MKIVLGRLALSSKQRWPGTAGWQNMGNKEKDFDANPTFLDLKTIPEVIQRLRQWLETGK